MTDEEIVKVLEWNAKHYEKMGYIDTSTGNVIVKSVKYQEVLDLIARLKSKYRNLEINYNGMYEHYRELSLEEPKLKAEIERLTEENNRLKEELEKGFKASAFIIINNVIALYKKSTHDELLSGAFGLKLLDLAENFGLEVETQEMIKPKKEKVEDES